MTIKDYHEQQFFNALNDIFVGAKIEGESGYINLMAIKSRYYTQGVFPQLKKDIAAAIVDFPEFREELFDKLYSFFQRYFSESGSIYFRHTPLHQNVYEKVYTDERDVVLFWKTHMLYYVKTDRLFKSMAVEVDEQKFWFDASQVELKRSNEKREVVFAYREKQADGTLVFEVSYSERGSKTKEEDILKALKKDSLDLSDETLNKAFRVFEKQSEVDFFINKDAHSFLREQFDLWMYQYLFEGQNVWSAERLAQLQALKDIAYKVIDFISQFEDELVKIWNKPKFVRNSHYVITFDKLAGSPVVEKLLAHPNMPQQVQEWRDLGMIGEDFRLAMLTQKDLTGAPLHPQHQHLPMDTKYFLDLELDILALFDDLDASLDGWLIHSENYQALKTLQSKFSHLVDIIYIDPPFNTAASEIAYENMFKRSSWLSLISERVRLSKVFTKETGMHCIAIDDFEYSNLKTILDNNLGEDNWQSTVAVRNNPHGRAMAVGFSQNHEYAVFYSVSKKSVVGRLPRTSERMERYPEKDSEGNFAWINFRKTGAGSKREDRPKLFYPVFVSSKGIIRISDMDWSASDNAWKPLHEQTEDETLLLPSGVDGEERVWNMGWHRAQRLANTDLISRMVSGSWQVYRKYRPHEEGALPGTWWDDAKYSATESGTGVVKNLFGNRELFSYPKSVFLLEDSLRASNCFEESITLDYFAGSGTTAHAVMNLNLEDGGNRKYILVEMGEHFNTVILPRIKKVAFNSTWKNGKPVFDKGESGTSHFVKYYELEQYEDVLQRAHYEDSDLFNDPNQDPYNSYVFLRDLKMLESLEIDQDNNRVRFHPERLYPDIDLAETLSHLTGKWIKRITKEYVEFEDGEQMSLTDPDWQVLKPMIWWQ